MFVHLTLYSTYTSPPLQTLEVATVLWRALRNAFPDAVACTLMPEHIHLLAPAESPADARRRALRALAAARRLKPPAQAGVPQWERVDLPREIPNRRHLERQVRYVALNPCRRGLVDDPLCWPWSTHRDVVGAAVDPWISSDQLGRALGRPLDGFAVRHHAYVSGDPSVRVEGTPFPRHAAADSLTRHPLAWVLEAAMAATRSRAEAVRSGGAPRELFIRLALCVGWESTERLAALCGMTPHGVRAVRRRDPRVELAPGLLCLGDGRLRVGFEVPALPASDHPPHEQRPSPHPSG